MKPTRASRGRGRNAKGGTTLHAPDARMRQDILKGFRIRRDQDVETTSVPATQAKNKFGRLLDTVMRGGRAEITKHNEPKAMLLSMEDFSALSRAADRELDALSDEFDALLARMQTPKARSGMKAAFAASPKQLGKAAVAAARRRG